MVMEFTLDEKYLFLSAIVSRTDEIKKFIKDGILIESLEESYKAELAAYESLFKKVENIF